MTPPVRRALALLAAAAATLLPWAVDRASAPPASLLVKEAQFAETIDDLRARPVALPHRWHADGCAGCRTVWYRFDLPLAEPPRDAQAIYLAGVADNAAAYLNGRLLGSGGRFSDPVAVLGARPLLLSAPVAWWQAGQNRLYVLVKAADPRHGTMPAPAFGAETSLRTLASWRTALVVTLPQVLAAAAAMLGLMMGVLWFYRRREADYALLAAASLAWAVAGFAKLVVEPPWPAPWWDAFGLAALALLAAALLAFAARLSGGAASPPTARWLAGGAALAAAAAAAAWAPPGLAQDAVRALAMLGCAVAGAWWFVAGWRDGDARRLVPGAMLTAAGFAEAAAALPALPAAPALGMPLALGALLGVAGWMLLLRFVETLNALELLNIDLEAMVSSRTAELEAQFGRVRELERAQTLATERERLMRDMHDGVGGHLVSMLAMIEADRRGPAELANVVRAALDDMRLMVDSLEPVDDDLNAVLAMFHDRLAPRLRAAKVELHWDVPLLPEVPGLGPARVLHVLRMLQEAVTNAIRHGHAQTLWIGAAADAGSGVRIEVRDDGGGFDPQAVQGGRGLKNLERRAQEIGAHLTIHSQPGAGARVVVTWAAGRG
ncbi:MAG: sensor histidine kinase [Rubrivivax sp.]|nr:sensor histidine kinase [Rubrivivax sp.]